MSFKQKAKLLIESFEVPIETDIIEPATKVIMAVGIFLCAILFRYGHYQDLIPMVAYGKQDFSGITAQHETTASAILKDGVQAIFPSEWRDKTDTSLIQYPPGYGLMLSAIYYVNGRDPSGVQFVQGILGSIAAVLVFLIALEIFNRYVALIAGLATAISHHLAYYSMLMIPDGVVPVFTLAGTYFFIRAFKVSWDKDKGYLELALAGLFYGLSCWIRANVLLVWVFLGLVLLISRSYLVDPLKRVALLTFILLLVISPLTVRNYLIYDEFIPISIGSGILFQAGIGEADTSLGIPAKDEQTMLWEAKIYNKPGYSEGLMNPDGIFRERERMRRSMEVIKERPFWYMGVMVDRINLITKYSAHAPLISRSPSNNIYQKFDYIRPLLRVAQRFFKEGLFVLLIIGFFISLKEFRRWLLIATIPLYYLLVHSVMHAEFRYVLPAHYLLFVFYAVAFYNIFFIVPRRMFDHFRSPDYTAKISAEPFERLQAPQLTPSNHDVVKFEPERSQIMLEEFEIEKEDTTTERVEKVLAEDVTLIPSIHRTNIGGIEIDNLDQQETIERIDRFIRAQRPRMMTVVNASKIVMAEKDPELRMIISNSHIVTADGMSVVWASKLLGKPLKERVTGIDTFEKLMQLATERGYQIYLLGAKPEVVEALVKKLQKQYSQIKIVGYRDGYFGQNEEVIGDIKAARPDILCIAMGSPRQEKWIAGNLEKLRVPFAIGVGGSFDHVAGFSKRAPVWMQQAGLEWLYRFLKEPTRLWKRYLVGNLLFISLVIKQAMKKKP